MAARIRICSSSLSRSSSMNIDGFFVDICERHHVGIEIGLSVLAEFYR